MAASCGYTIHQYPAFIRGPIWSHFQSTHLRHYYSSLGLQLFAPPSASYTPLVKNHFFYHSFGVYTVVFCLQNGTKTVSFWGQKNSENTLRIQSCYYISLQKSPIVASILSMGKKQPRRVHASAKRYQILASNSDGVNATTLLWAKSRTFRVII